MKLVYSIFTAAFLASCTVTINQIDTPGEAEDLIENTPTTSPTIDTEASVPVSLMPKR